MKRGCEITVSTEKEDFSFILKEKSFLKFHIQILRHILIIPKISKCTG